MRHVVYLNKVRLNASLPAVNFSLGNACGLAEAGARCTLIAQSAAPDFDTSMMLSQFEIEPNDRLRIVARPVQRRFGIRTNQWFYLDAVRQIMALHQSDGVDAVISRDPGALPYLKRLKRRTGIRTFYQPHNFYADLSCQQDINRKNARKYRWLEKHFIPDIDGVLCLQKSQRDLFRRYFPDHYIVASPPGVLRLHPRPALPDQLNRIVYVGSLQLKKGIETLLRAMSCLGAEFRLSLIGGRNPREIDPVRTRIESLGLQNRVEITGWLPFREVERRLMDAAAGILPLEDTFYNRYLTAPNKLFDYFSRGIPVVASDLPAIREFLSESEGVFVPAGDPEAFARGILQVCAHRTEYAARSLNCMKKAEASLWKVRAGEMLAHIEKTF